MSSHQNSATPRSGRTRKVILALAIWAALALGVRLAIGVFAAEPATTSFNQTWQRTDDPVASGLVDRTWMWGPEGFTDAMTEPYIESPGGERTVQYFDKSRMEDNAFRGTAPWDVTNGLLVVELITGRMQMGDNSFTQYTPANVNVAGDQGVAGVQYATLAGLLTAPALADGATITQRLDRSGNVSDDPSLASFGVTAAQLVSVPGSEHQVASPFWQFINSHGAVYESGSYVDAPIFLSAFYATGYPITEAYWANVKVGGTYQDILLQCFERRCLTYTPDNDPGWQVEAGNVGQHYYTWRYGQAVEEPTATPPTTGTVESSPTTTPVDGTQAPSSTEAPGNGTPPASPTAEPTATTEPSSSPTAEPAPDYRYAGKFGGQFEPDDLLDEPVGVAASDDGYVYITEWGAERVQKYTTDGLFVTMWKSNSPQDIAVDSSGHVYVTDTENNRVRKFSAGGQPLGEVQGASPFVGVEGIGVDGDDNLYVVDYDRIHKFDSNGVWVAGLRLVAVDIATGPDDVRYVLDANNYRVRKIGSDGSDLGYWGDSSTFNTLTNIAVSDSGVIYVVDTLCSLCLQQTGIESRVQAFDSNGTLLDTWGGSGSEPGQFQTAQGVAVDADGNVFVADYGNNRIQKFNPNGNYLDGWLGPHRGRFTGSAAAMTLDEDGNVYVADSGRVQKFDPGGRFIWEASELSAPVDLEAPSAIVASPDGNLFVADGDLDKIVKFTLDGDFVQEWSGFEAVTGLALDDGGDLWVLEFDAKRLRKFSPNGTPLGTWNPGGVLTAPLDIAIDGDRLYVVDIDPSTLRGAPSDPTDVPAVKIFDLDDRSFLGALGEPGQFITPYRIGIDANGYIYVTDINANTVQQFAPDGTYLTTIGGPGGGNGRFNTPAAVQIASDGTLYVLDAGNFRVQVFEPQ